MLSQEIIQRWQTLKEEMFTNKPFVEYQVERDERRITVRQEIVELCNGFLDNKIGIEVFRSTFDRRTRTDWNVFGLKGLSGAMFLNILVKHIPDQTSLDSQLKQVLKVPRTIESGYQQMQNFQTFLEEIIESGSVARRLLQLTRLPYLVSGFWHMQDIAIWPIFYLSGRQAFAMEGFYRPTGDPTSDYFSFREIFVDLAQTLKLQPWEMEHLCVWYQERNVEITEPVSDTQLIDSEKTDNLVPITASNVAESKSNHTQIQLLLAKIGKRFKYNVWIASNDHNRSWNGEKLNAFSISELPHFNGIGPRSQRILELIDVIWLKGTTKIVAAFEVESTTSIYSGLLRMSDLLLALENLAFPVYIAVPSERIGDVQAQLSRLTFQRIGLHEVCRFFSFEALFEESENIMRWASDYTAMEKISQRVSAINDEDYY